MPRMSSQAFSFYHQISLHETNYNIENNQIDRSGQFVHKNAICLIYLHILNSPSKQPYGWHFITVLIEE